MYIIVVYAVNSDSFKVLTSDCSCPNFTLSYKCTVVGGPGGDTTWKGTAFNCPNRRITLLHRTMFPNESSDSQNQTVVQSCNSGAIKAWGVGVKNNTYTSRLNVTLNADTYGRSIECFYEDGKGNTTEIGSSLITGILKLKPSDMLLFVHYSYFL